jgi:NADH dehydrogenase
LTKLPRLEKKLRVAFDWSIDLLFSKDLVHFMILRAPTMSRPEVESDEIASPKP